MKKKIVAGLAGLALVTSLHAQDDMNSERIIGLEIGSGTIEADTLLGGDNYRGNDVEYGLRLGAQNTDWRTLLVLNYYDNTDDDQKYFKGLASFDYLLMEASEFRPYLGLNVGYIDYTSQDNDDSGFLYGGQVGFLYRVAEHVQVDVTYRYSWASADHVNHVEDIVFGINYIF